jgi:hypothetical protein
VSSYTYDPAKVVVVCGIPPIPIAPLEGFAPGTMISATFHKPEQARIIHGVRGTSTRGFLVALSGRIEFELEQMAPHNALLSAAQIFDRSSKLGVGVFGIKDLSSALDIVAATQAWIVGMPEWQRATEAGTIRWTVDCKMLQIFHGGGVQMAVESLRLLGPPGVQ